MEIHGRQVTLRPLVPADASRLVEILQAPEVARWWTGYDQVRVESEFQYSKSTGNGSLPSK